MSKNYMTMVGTVGTGIWISGDGGESWSRCKGMWNETQVFALTPHPQNPKVIFAGAHDGIYRSDDGGVTFEPIASPLSGKAIWSVAFDPVQPDTIFAGSRPGAVFRSRDGGQTWEQLNAQFAHECPNVRFPRVLTMAVDPADHRVVWAGAEVDGVRRSLDGGETWETTGAAVTPGKIGRQLNDPDIHGIAVSGTSPSTVFVSTPREIFASTDRGELAALGGEEPLSPALLPWHRREGRRPQRAVRGQRRRSIRRDRYPAALQGPWPYLGDAAPARRAQHAHLDLRHARADPNLVLTCSHYGQVFVSEDAGDSWRKVRREFSEIRALAWVPN